MQTICLMPFRLGLAASEPLSEDFIKFYLGTIDSLTGKKSKLADPQQPITIPLDNAVIQNNPQEIYNKFWEYITDLKIHVDFVILDLTNPPRGMVRASLLLHLSQAIHAVFHNPLPHQHNNNPPTFLILMRELPPEKEVFRNTLSSFISDGRVILISDDGKCLHSGIVSKSFRPARYRLHLASVREDPLELLKRKMIRRLGHFKRMRNGKHYRCDRYFYDGALCQQEVAELVMEHIEKIYYKRSKPLILFHLTISKWLQEPLHAVATKLGLQCFSVNDVREIELHKVQSMNSLKPLLIVPLVYSGQTLKSVLQELKMNNLITMPNILSILSTHATDKKQRIRQLVVEGETFSISYLMLIDKRSYTTEDCPMCKLDIPESLFSRDDHAKLTSYDMWELAEESGWKPEDAIPTYREGLSIVPNYPLIIENHGAWLAIKFQQMLTSSLASFPSDPIVVCPDEEEGSSFLTDSLRLYFGITVIRIPREIINSCFKNPNKINVFMSQWEDEKPQWFVQLLSASANEIIIIDEFNFSGGTRQGLRNLIIQFNKTVLCYFAVQDFDPIGSRVCGVPTYSFYEFQLYDVPKRLSNNL